MFHFNRYTAGTLLLVLLYMLAPRQLSAQTPLRGTVVDDYGYPVQAAVVRVRGTQTTTITAKDGSFQLNTSKPAVLVIEKPGFNTAEVKATQGRALIVRMPQSYIQLPAEPRTIGDTILVPNTPASTLNVLYGQTNQKSFLGSIATAGSSQLSSTPAPGYLYALPGRLAGLNVMQTSGLYSPPSSSLTSVDIFVGNIPNNTSGAGPTDNTEFSVQLRGHNASAGQSPIAVVDGVQREWYSLDPESIESVSVLKDALSTMLLGQNSARGALIVTTKQPVTGPPRVSFTAETGVQTPINMPTPLPAYQYAYLLNEALLNDGKAPAYTAADFNALAQPYRPHRPPRRQLVQDDPSRQREAHALQPQRHRRRRRGPLSGFIELYEPGGTLRHLRRELLQYQRRYQKIYGQLQGRHRRQ
ncbi:carboxypeptidase regulatory-like domain-containing protein [Puia sp. P3]|uniref:carboxypeptidase regulatory-like domain-containing protein n=1 Tax=Puia sp. P3 TaxID=3423952 RepID=UPI003D672FC5